MKFHVAAIAGALLLLSRRGFRNEVSGATATANQSSREESGYVGSKACSKCHRSIYESFSRTDMGRSMSEITPEILERIPTSANILDVGLKRHFEIFARDNSLYQSEYETAADGKDIFREMRKLEWIIGSGPLRKSPSAARTAMVLGCHISRQRTRVIRRAQL
jgi:hypothetical protein